MLCQEENSDGEIISKPGIYNSTFALQANVPTGAELAQDHPVTVTPDTTAHREVEINLYGQKLSELSVGRQQDLSISNFRKVGMIEEVDDEDSEDSDMFPKNFFRRRFTENTRHLEHAFKRAFG